MYVQVIGDSKKKIDADQTCVGTLLSARSAYFDGFQIVAVSFIAEFSDFGFAVVFFF